jgi:enoyl-CoA hydratase/carnithine racemase
LISADLSWQVADGVVELALHREPCNEIGSVSLEELERFTEALQAAGDTVQVVILHSRLECGFSAGADLRELYRRSQEIPEAERLAGVRDFLERIHRVMNSLDGASLPVIAAVHGVCFGGGFELALASDLIIADRMARFCFPELRLGLIPGFGGVPRLKRDLGNAVVRDLLLTGRSINATKAQAVGLVSQVVGEGEALRVARATAARSSIPTPSPPPSSSSSRFPTRNSAVKSSSSARSSPARPFRRPCASSSKAKTPSPTCHDGDQLASG